MKYPVGAKVRLLPTNRNIEYFNRNFRGIDIHEIYTVVRHHPTPDCIFLDCKEKEAIAYQRFERIPDSHFNEELFKL